jgi:Arf-GAP/SH3 domain/ANK repeat/PH domain-containing protein
MKSLEQKTGNMRVQMKKVLKKAEAAQQAQVECNQAMSAFLQALQEASGSNATAFKPALDHYFTNIAQRILKYEKENGALLQRQIIEPLSKLYNLDIKQAESKKKDFEDESRDYYAYVSRYLGQRQESLKDKKRAETSDSKYQNKKKNFELKRFDYSTFMQDLHGGRKEQELLSQLTKYADGQAKSFLAAAKRVESLTPQLDALVKEVAETDKEYKLQRTEREEKRRNLEKNGPVTNEREQESSLQHSASVASQPSVQNGHINTYSGYSSDTDLSRADSTSSQFGYASTKTLSPTANPTVQNMPNSTLSTSPSGSSIVPTPSKFKGIRDLDESSVSIAEKLYGGQHRKEGLLWALSRPGSHIDPKGINKQAWHK